MENNSWVKNRNEMERKNETEVELGFTIWVSGGVRIGSRFGGVRKWLRFGEEGGVILEADIYLSTKAKIELQNPNHNRI